MTTPGLFPVGGAGTDVLDADPSPSPKTSALSTYVPETSYPASFAQQRIWVLSQMGRSADAYVITRALRLRGPLDTAALAATLEGMMARHDILRTRFTMQDDALRQIVEPDLAPPLMDRDLSDASDPDAACRALLQNDMAAPFDFARAPLWRVRLCKLGDGDWVLALIIHHIIADAWSLELLQQELALRYQAIAIGVEPALPAPQLEYRDYAIRQRAPDARRTMQAARTYWLEKLADPTLLELPSDMPGPRRVQPPGTSRRCDFDPIHVRSLKALATRHGASLFMALTALVKLLLYRYSHQRDIIVGTPVAGRDRAELETIVGLFMNVVALRDKVDPGAGFTALLDQVARTAYEAFAHQHCPLEELIGELGVERDATRAPLFDVLVALQNVPAAEAQVADLRISQFEAGQEAAKYDLLFEFSEHGDGLVLNLTYSTGLFSKTAIERLCSHLERLLEGVLAAPEAPVGTMPLLTRAERNQIADWSGGESPYPRDAALTELFGEMVQAAPDAVALRFGDETLTYAALDARAKRLAAYIDAQHEPGAVIGLCLPRGVDLIVAMLATLKTGAAYLPLDPDLPADRLGYMLEKAEVTLVLSHEVLADVLPEGGHAMLLLDRDADQIDTCDADVPAPQSDGSSLAYVMYTSGSTGQPKGVMVPQRAVTRLVRDTDYIDIKPGDRIAQAATPVFDAATFEIWGALLNGAAIELLQRDDILDPDRFTELLRQGRFNTMFLTATLFNRMVQIDPSLFAKLDTLLVGGEALDPRWIRAVLEEEPPTRLLNGYGPTECTTFAVCHHITEVPEDAASIPIGHPIANTVAHILDPDGQPVPRGIAGELHLGGDGLADGYLAQPELTEERFITHDTLGRLYRTGDLCRWNQDGAIDYLGRTDHQIKLRGFRIELGEIEAALRALPAVEEAVAILAGDGEHRRIVAYVTGTGLDGAALRRELQTALPGYMVPSEVMLLDALPLTVTGKLDRKALPVPDMASKRAGAGAPMTPGEELLAGLWADVLKTGAVGRSDNFFDLGGHSLLATQLLSRIRTAFGADIALRLLFEHPTLSAQAAAIERERRGTPPPPIVRREDRDTLPLSFAQQRLWFLAELEGADHAATYNITAALGLDAALDETALRAALTALTARHESLRMTVHAENGQPVLGLRAPYDPLVVEDLVLEEGEDRDAAVSARAARHAASPFDLAGDPLLRLTLLRLDANAQVLLVNLHHIAADGWSLGVLVRDLSAFYAAALQEHEADLSTVLPPLQIQYADYAAWQRDWLSGDVLETQLSYWRDRLGDAPSLLELPADRPRPAVKSYSGGQRALTLPPELTERLEAFSRTRGATLFMTLLAAFKVLLHRYSGSEDILVGSPIANRTQAESEELVGFFVNTLVMRSTIERTQNFEAVLSQLRETALDAYAHQDLPFESLVTELQPERSLSHSPLFQVMFALQNAPQEVLALGEATIQPLQPDLETAKFDLTLSIEAGSGGLACNWEYAADLFEPSRIDRMAAHYRILLESILAAPEAPVGTLPLLTHAERDEIADWSGGESPYPRDASLTELFEETVQAAPNAVALRSGDEILTYAELDARADRLAAYIAAQYQPVSGAVIGLCLPRGINLITAMLATLKTGAAYLPLDPDLPADRLGYMLEEAEVTLVLSHEVLADVLPEGGHAMLLLDRDADQIDTCDADVPAPQSDGSSLAYVMYTSGSTGRPKGVMVPQRAVTRLVRDTDYIDIKPGDRIAQAATPVFDAATFEIWGALLNGAAIELLQRDDILDTERFVELLREKRFTILFLTTALFNRMAQIDAALFSGLDTLLFGGEAVDPRWVRAVLKAGPPKRLLHVYGPTECTTYATWHEVHAVADDAASVPIGGPLANTTAHILDPDGNPVPAGIAGELHLGGDGLADEYLAQPELTEERFIDHPSFGRLYRTGDLCRWNQDGAIDYLGRTDHQIKLRGFRIELGEIEAALRARPDVEEAVAILAGEGEHRRIVAYVTGKDLDGGVLRRELQTNLPGYMVPSEVIVLDALPLTVTGKLDRKALPVPEMAPAAQTYEAPRTDREIALATIWGGVLGRERIGRNDNFFELGGDSILSIQIVAQARSAGLRLAVRDIFKHQTIAALAPHAASIVLSEEAATKNPVGPAPLTPVQSWFFCWDLADLSHFNQALLLRPNEKISTEELQAVARAIIARHAALRLHFRHGADGWQQEPAEIPGDLPVHEEDLRDLPIEAQADAMAARASHWQRSLDLEGGPVMRLVLFELTSGQRLLWCIHHLAVDGVSWRILLGDLDHAFAQIRQGADIFLEPAPASFADWAHYLQSLAGTPEIAEAVNYWRGWQATPPLPKDDPAGVARWDSTEHVRVSFDQETTAALLEQVPRAFGTRINDILLTALALALSDWTGRSDWPIALESHGRPERPGAPDLSETVGWFTAIYPVRLDLPDRTDLAACLKAVKEQLRAIPGEGLAYGIGRYLAADAPDDFPDAEIAFNYLGQFEADAGAGFFSVAEESTGESQCLDGTRPHAVDINGLVSDGALTLSLSYSSQQYRPETMESLAQGFETALRALVDLCRDEAACGYTASDFPLAPVTQERLDRLAVQQGRGVAALYPLSPMQQGMAFHSLADDPGGPGGSVYFEQLTWKIASPFRPDSFRAAWHALVERHPILRTALWLDGGEPLQFVRHDTALPWRNLDWRDLDEAAQTEALEQLLAEERGAGFDLTRPPLLRCLLVRLEEDVWQFVLGFHHLLLDGWSLPILFRDLMRLYGSRSTDLPAAAPYEHYIAWLQQQDHAAARAHWQRAVADIDAPTPLPGTRTTAPDGENTAQPNEKNFTFEPALGQALIETARQRHLTLNTLFNAGWALVLSRTSGERDSIFGVTLSGRDIDLAGIEDMVGLFINTVPMRVSTEDCPVGVWLDALQAQHQDNSRFGFVPLADIQQDSALPPGTALFNSLLVFENYPLDPDLPAGEGMDEGGGAHFSDGRAIDHTNYPLTLIAAAHGDEIRLRVGYDETQFTADDIDRIFAFLSTALRGLIDADADQPLDRIGIVSDAERETLWEMGRARCHLPVTDTLIERFAEQVARHADRPAVTCAGETLTYAELDARADDIARRISALGAGPERLVGLLAERSVDLIAGLLGIVKSGAAYLPVDPATPAARVAFMLEDAGAIALVTERTLAEDHSAWEGPRLYLDDPPEADDTSPPCARIPAQPDDMAYVIYTSGSTGQPKGVMVSHANVLRLFDATQPDCHFSADDVWTMFHSVAFDFSVWEIWGALLHGGHLIVIPDEVRRNPAAFHTLLEHESVTVLNQTPSAFRHLIPEAVERGRTLSLRLVIFGGEALDLPGLKPWFTLYGDEAPRLVNMYGITETTVHVTWCPLTEADCSSTASLIGNPLRDLDLHLLDRRGEPVPVGVAGEIHVGGAGLARGYLNRPELTAERFIVCTVEGTAQRLYRSGDLARRRADGSLEYLGRMDKQVKLRGYRIEIGEIEATLSQHPAVRQVAVVAQQEEGRLVAYLVADSEAPQEVRDWAASRLPGYMVPAIFVPIERIPLTRNGKTDHAALPKPEARAAIDPGSTAPANAVEQSLVEIWRDVLGVGNIGTEDDFFALGGHSLKALQVVSRINQVFGRRLPVGLLLKNPTIGALAPHIGLEGAAAYEPIRPTPAQESYPLSHAQRRFWLEDRLAGDARYNMPAAFELKQQIDADALRNALAELIERHEILRTVFVEVDGEPRQKVLETIDVPLTSVDLGDAEDADAQTRAIVAEQNRTRFALDQAPLFRVTLITRDGGSTVFVLVMHHIIGDGWSMQIFYRELLTLYDAAFSGARSALPPLEIQYRDYAVLQDARDRTDDARYWTAQLDGLDGPLHLPRDIAPNAGDERRGERVGLELSEECTKALRALSRARGTTPANTLLALFKLFLFQLTRQEDICVGMAVANRGRPELEPLLGAFVNLLPLRTQVSADMDFDALLDRVTRTSTAALDHQDYPYDLMLSSRKTGPGRDPVNVIYAYQNTSNVNIGGGKTGDEPDGAEARQLDLAFPFAKVDLMLMVAERQSRLELTLEYDADLFTAEAAERYLNSLNRFAEAVAADAA